jgi:hypothetical protein
MLDAKDRCLSCWDEYANKICDNKVDVWRWSEHDVWTIEKCGHAVCKAMQGEMECSLDPESDECAICKKQGKRAAILVKEEDNVTAQAIRTDVPLMKALVHQLQSSSAKAAIQTWLAVHDTSKVVDEGAKKAASGDVKRQKR